MTAVINMVYQVIALRPYTLNEAPYRPLPMPHFYPEQPWFVCMCKSFEHATVCFKETKAECTPTIIPQFMLVLEVTHTKALTNLVWIQIGHKLMNVYIHTLCRCTVCMYILYTIKTLFLVTT